MGPHVCWGTQMSPHVCWGTQMGPYVCWGTQPTCLPRVLQGGGCGFCFVFCFFLEKNKPVSLCHAALLICQQWGHILPCWWVPAGYTSWRDSPSTGPSEGPSTLLHGNLILRSGFLVFFFFFKGFPHRACALTEKDSDR